MPARVVAAALLTALLAAGCRGGAGTEERPGPATLPPTAAPSLPESPSPSVVAKHGGVRVTYAGTEFAWEERGCESTRDASGKVVGWLATFQDAVEQSRPHRVGVTESRSYLQVRVRRYRGVGTYGSADVSVRLVPASEAAPLETAFGTPGQTLTIADDGHAAVYRGSRARFDLSCDPSDDTSTRPGEAVPATPAPGTAWVARPGGAVFRFDDVRCTGSGSATTVTAGAFPHFFRLTPEGSSGQLLFAVHGVVLVLEGPGTRVAARAGSGTFRHRQGGREGAAGETRGAYACG